MQLNNILHKIPHLIQTGKITLLLSFFNKMVVNLHLLLILLDEVIVSLSRSRITATKRPHGGVVNISQASADTSSA